MKKVLKLFIYFVIVSIGTLGYCLYFKSGYGYINLIGLLLSFFISIPGCLKLLEWLKLGK